MNQIATFGVPSPGIELRKLAQVQSLHELLHTMDQISVVLSDTSFSNIEDIADDRLIDNVCKALSSLLAEEWIEENDIPDYIADCIRWISIKIITVCTKRQPVGRLEIKNQIKQKYQNQPFATAHSSPICHSMKPDPNNTNSVHNDNDVNKKSENDVNKNRDNNDKDRDALKTTKTAYQLFKYSGLKTFDGAAQIDRYLVWKHQLLDYLCSCRSIAGWVRFEILVHAITDGALMNIRTLIRNKELYNKNPETAEKEVFHALDQRYDTVAAIRHVDGLFDKLSQLANETVDGYLTRFENTVHIFEQIKQTKLDDINLISKFSKGLNSQTAVTARALADAAQHTQFDKYAQAVLNYAKINVVPMPKNAAINNAMTTKNKFTERNQPDMCYRCKTKGHTSLNCTKDIKLPENACTRCGYTNHSVEHCKRILKEKCRRCGGDHFQSICPNQVEKSNGTYSQLVNNNAIRVRCQPIQTTTANLVCNNTPLIKIAMKDHTEDALLDFGASANFVSIKLARLLLNQGTISRNDIHPLKEELEIIYGVELTK